ncbi:hypothetical protein NQ176_g1247 [Zarea fungicola]|uniref:Uncharacterized protein n=1 Tax=Zarea fungicola TaxID=93591 RepID=A0ACC1NUM9_9HYPO|nr:hypothetical protein NQ176_g1247 [Lecanicillium fungicola]
MHAHDTKTSAFLVHILRCPAFTGSSDQREAMANTAPVSPDILCAEAIAFLHLLHPVPAEPSINPGLQQSHHNPAAYSLPFNKERDFVNTLAFLSNIGEDPNHVPALCMHETPRLVGSEVIIAVNQTCHGDGLSTLNDIKNGFQRIFHSLSQVLQIFDAEKAVFTNIVTMCSLRIRERMRYAPQKRNKSKQTLKQLLEQTSAILRGKFPEFHQQAKVVIKIVDAWLKHQTDQRLCDLVEALVQLSHSNNLSLMLSSIPNTLMGPSERRNLLKMIWRVARYREAARFLYRTAKKFPVIRDMQIVMVSLPKTAFRSLPMEYQADFLVTCARLQVAHRHQSNVARVTRLLGRPGQSAEELFTYQSTKTLREGKIHAEIQLIYYLETNRPKPAPRVVASSKMACFLCNVFLCQVAKVYTKRCHGRLYPAWKLPVFTSPSGLERLFLQTLESYIRSSVTTLLSRQRRTLFPQPSESTLWTMGDSATTAGSLPRPGIMLEELQRRESSVNTSEELPSIQATIASEPVAAPVERTESSKNAAILCHRMDLFTALQGSTAMVAISTSGVAGVQAGSLFIQLEYTVGKNGVVGSTLECSLEWLTREDANAVMDNKDMYIVDVESLDGGLTIPGPNLKALCIATGGNIVKLSLR